MMISHFRLFSQPNTKEWPVPLGATIATIVLCVSGGLLVVRFDGYSQYKAIVLILALTLSGFSLLRLEWILLVTLIFLPFNLYANQIGVDIGAVEVLVTLTAARFIVGLANHEIRWPRTPFDRPVTLLLTGLGLSQFLGATGLAGWYSFFTWVTCAIFFYACVACLRTRNSYHSYVLVLVAVSVVPTAIGYLQHFVGFPMVPSYMGLIDSTFGYYTNFGNYLLAILLIHLAGCIQPSTPLRSRVLFFGCLFVLLPLVILLGSRSTWLGLIIGSVGLLIITLASARAEKRYAIWIVLFAILTLGVMAHLTEVMGLQDRLEFLFTGTDNSIATRQLIWSSSVEIIRISPIIGQGILSSPVAFEGIVQWSRLGSLPIVHHAHNILLTLWIEGGMLSVLGLVGMIYVVVGMIFRARFIPEVNSTYSIWLGAIVALLGILGQGTIDYVYREFSNTLLLFTILALVSAGHALIASSQSNCR